MPLTDQGYRAKRAAEWLEEIRNAYETETGLSIDWTRDQFVSQITAIMATRLGQLSESAQGLYDTFDVDNATGTYLDVLCALSGVTRQQATASTVDLRLSGDSGTTIPEGSQVEDPEGRIWESNSDATIESDGDVIQTFSANTLGSLTLQAGQIDTANDSGRIATPVNGWDSAYSPNDAIPGRDRESDPELRARRQESLQVVGAASIPSVRASLERSVDGLQSAVVVDNPTNQTEPIPGTSIDQEPHSTSVIVWPDTASEITQSEYEQQIADELAETVAAGIRTNGNQSQTVTMEDGSSKSFRWRWAQTVSTDAEVIVTMATGYTFTSDLQAEIEDVVADYFAGLDVGNDVRRLPVLGELASFPELDSAEVRYAEAGNTPADQDIPIGLIEIAQLNSTNVHT